MRKPDLSIHDISVRANKGKNLQMDLGHFLDAFYAAGRNTRIAMIKQPPEDTRIDYLVPFLAATAHKLANDHRLKPPTWAFEPRCYLPGDKPYFATLTGGELRRVLMCISPPEFKHRNLFVSDNALSRR
jgi:hypothetical protein